MDTIGKCTICNDSSLGFGPELLTCMDIIALDHKHGYLLFFFGHWLHFQSIIHHFKRNACLLNHLTLTCKSFKY